MQNKFLLLVIAFFVLTLTANAQTAEERAKIVAEYAKLNPQSKNARLSFENAVKAKEADAELRVQAFLKKYPLRKRSFMLNGSLYFLTNVDAEGNPSYINTKNRDSGIMIKANQLYQGGSIGVNITGQNMVAGVWDGGQVRATHELLSGKVGMQANQTLDGSGDNFSGNNHQTHVTGTMVGKSLANKPSVRGIAFEATTLNYDFANPFIEMQAFAGNGYLISNHSYGYGNNEGDPIWRFGAYDFKALNTDIITADAPNYLPFFAAGNEQDTSFVLSNGKRLNGNRQKGGYDMISGESASKNAMTVGALNGDKAMSNYSCWGPTDDGRVKPDIVARGTGINSSTFGYTNPVTGVAVASDTSYSGNGTNSSGTSYSTPAVAAAGLLLQQYYHSLYGTYMKAATLKSLMLGTAEDLGQTGPDNKFGWGLLDVEKAARAIKFKSATGLPASNSLTDASSKGAYIEEITYNIPNNNSSQLTRNITASGCEPLIVSIAWTDDAGVEQVETNGVDPTTSRLVHNFDFVVRNTTTNVDVRTWKPSTMANRTADATLETDWFDGNGNNYKQVKISNPVAGQQYAIIVRKSTDSPATAKGFSLVVTGTSSTPIAGSNSPVNVGSAINLTSSGGTSQVWAGPSSFTSTAQNPVIASATAVMGGVYTVTITSSGTCTATATTNVVVNPAPTSCTPPTGATAGSNSPVTEGSPINLTSSSTGGTSQSWLGSNGYTSTAQNPVIATLAAGVYNYTVTITSSGTCVATATTSVRVNSAPATCTPPTVTAGSNSPITVGGNIFLTATFPNSGIASWVGPNSYTSTGRAPIIAGATLAAAGVYTVTVASPSTSTCTVTLTVNVVVNPVVSTCTPPTRATAGSNSPVIEGSPINLTSSSTGGTSQSWLGSNGYTSTAQNPVIASLAAGFYTYTVTIKSSGTCVATATTTVRVNSVTTSTVVFVNVANTNTTQNGNSWATAYSNMQTALSSAPANSEFWVAKGVYKPTATTDRGISFNIPSGAKLYGGFVGTETMLSEGNVEGNPTILSGEIGSPSTANDNSYHVVTFIGASSATILDGFTVTGGNASFNSTRLPSPTNISASEPLSINDGGGIGLDNGSSPTIINCKIISNDAFFGGGLYATNNSNPMVKNSVFMNNQATFGGGIYNLSSSPTYSNILIAGNKATGGAMYNNGSNPTITNVTIAGNGGYNGAVFNSNSAPVIKNSILWGNISPFNDTQSVTSYSIVEGGYLGIGNLNVNPQFINLSPFGLSPSLSGDYKLTNTSPAIDAGDNGVVGMTDTELGNFPRRFNNGIVDIGAYEFQGSRMGGTVTSIVSGNWETGTTWNIGRKPLAGDTVIINNNHIVTINNDGVMKNIEIRPNATLLYKTSGIKLQSGF